MPFNIQIIDKRDESTILLGHPDVVAVYATGQDAAGEVERRKRLYHESMPYFSYRILKIEESDESDDWQEREKDRFANGQYAPVPWENEPWAKAFMKGTPYHFVHMSMDKTGMVAYTESPEKGRDDVQKRMRPGRYLSRFFPHALTQETIRYWACKVSLLSGESQEFKIAMTPDEIQHVYTHGPHSCMANDACHYQSSEHPTRMYGAGDLGVAYIERESSIAARVLVWPDKKIWGKPYGDGGVYMDQLKDLLGKEGYESGERHEQWKGARLIRVETRDGFIAPYLDVGGSTLTDKGEYLEISLHGEIDAQSENGVTGPRDTCDGCSEPYNAEEEGGCLEDYNYCQSCYETRAVYCEDCESTIHRDDVIYLENIERGVCESCAGSYPMCDLCSEQFPEKDMNSVSKTGETVCDSCYSDDYAVCSECDDSDKTANMKEDDNGETLCESCHDSQVDKGETTGNRVESENQGELLESRPRPRLMLEKELTND